MVGACHGDWSGRIKCLGGTRRKMPPCGKRAPSTRRARGSQWGIARQGSSPWSQEGYGHGIRGSGRRPRATGHGSGGWGKLPSAPRRSGGFRQCTRRQSTQAVRERQDRQGSGCGGEVPEDSQAISTSGWRPVANPEAAANCWATRPRDGSRRGWWPRIQWTGE